MLIFFIFLFFALNLYSEHTNPLCKPTKNFCVYLNGPKEVEIDKDMPEFFVSIKNISGKDFEDEEVAFYIGVSNGTLFAKRYNKDDYTSIEYDGRVWFHCKKWQAGEERIIEVQIYDLTPIGWRWSYGSTIGYLPRENFLYVKILKPSEEQLILNNFFFKVIPYTPNEISRVKINIKGPDIVLNGSYGIFEVTVKNIGDVYFKENKEYNTPEIVMVFGREDGDGLDVSNFEILENTSDKDIYITDLYEIYNTYSAYYVVKVPIGDFSPGSEHKIKIKIYYNLQLDYHPYIFNYYKISPFAVYFRHFKKSENDLSIDTSSGKSVLVSYLPEEF